MKINSDGADLTAAEISKFKTLLLAKRNEILGDILSMEDNTLCRQKGDLSNLQVDMANANDGSENYEIENTLELMYSERELLREINEALGRIENGIYGTCQGSGKQIPKARLEAIPWTKFCVEYAVKLEKGLVKRKSSSLSTGYNFGIDEDDDASRETYRRIVG